MDGSAVDLLDSSWQVLRMFEDHRESEHFKIIQQDEHPLSSKDSKIVQVRSICYLASGVELRPGTIEAFEAR
jgi:hypothetical protein